LLHETAASFSGELPPQVSPARPNFARVAPERPPGEVKSFVDSGQLFDTQFAMSAIELNSPSTQIHTNLFLFGQ
jgi:hypothetical protein